MAGVTVVALEQAVSAPMCTRMLADFGARVIKVENPNGGDFARDYDDVVNGPDGLAAHFVWCNRGKESVTLNLKSSAGMEVLHLLLDQRRRARFQPGPGATAPARHHTRRPGGAPPDVIAVEIDGYGPGGPLSHKRAYDLLVQAESGVCAVTGYRAARQARSAGRRYHAPGCTRRCRSWRCCPRATRGRGGAAVQSACSTR